MQQRIVSYEPEVDPTDLLAHPLNARRHPGTQRDALRESLDRVGWVDAVKVNVRTQHVVDGHARIEEAITAGTSVPVLYIDVSEDEERFVLATLDPIGALATYDAEVLANLMDGIEIGSSALLAFLDDQRALDIGPPGLDDLAAEYDPSLGGMGGGGDDVICLTGINGRLLVRWAEHRDAFDSDDEALEALLP